MEIVLASASPRRRALLEALGLTITVKAADVDESLDGDPVELAIRNARAKRDAVAVSVPDDALVIAADTVVVLDDHVLGKPADLEEARAMLRRLSGNTHKVVTAVAVVHLDDGRAAEAAEITEVTFRALSEEDIEAFVHAVKPLDRAGAYTVDGPGALLVASYKGCYQNVLGLPVVRLDELCRSIGVSLTRLADASAARFL